MAEGYKSCPYCEAKIADNAKKCEHCGEIVVEEKEIRQCPYCEAEVSESAKKCKYCGEWLEKEKNIIDSEKNDSYKINNKKNGTFINNTDNKNRINGRATRTQFILVYMCCILISIIISIIYGAITFDGFGADFFNKVHLALIIAISLSTLLLPFPRRIKRLHDTGQSGWYCLLYIFVGASSLFDLYLILYPGQKKDNQYGEIAKNKKGKFISSIRDKIVIIILFLIIIFSLYDLNRCTKEISKTFYSNKTTYLKEKENFDKDWDKGHEMRVQESLNGLLNAIKSTHPEWDEQTQQRWAESHVEDISNNFYYKYPEGIGKRFRLENGKGQIEDFGGGLGGTLRYLIYKGIYIIN